MRAVGTLMMMRAWRKCKTREPMYLIGSFLYHATYDRKAHRATRT